MIGLSQKQSLPTAEQRLFLTGVERTFRENDIIVSKTDTRGIMTYVNDVFLDVSGYRESEMIGRPHSIIRHPDMPRCVFKVLWDTISQGKEIFAYVLNRAKNGDHYWVFAHVTPNIDMEDHKITGYHSSRRVPRKSAVEKIIPIYKALCEEERKYSGSKQIEASLQLLTDVLAKEGIDYGEFVFSL